MTATTTVRTFDVDLASLATAFGRRLHEADIPVTPEQSARFVSSLTLTQPRSRRALYFTSRAIFVTDMEQLGTFDDVFAAVFDWRAATG